MSSDFNFTVTFLGNVGIKPYFNTQCPCLAPSVPTALSTNFGWPECTIAKLRGGIFKSGFRVGPTHSTLTIYLKVKSFYTFRSAV